MAFITKIATFLWPIKYEELKKFLPMSFIMFLIIFNYNLLHALKDSILITSIGAESISALKLWGVLPSAFICMIIYAKLLDIFDKNKTFYIITSFFIINIILFGFFFYQYPTIFHPNKTSIYNLANNYPNLKWLIFLFGKWSYALFFIIAELWGSFMLSLLFWQFANQITYTSEAKRFYPMFGLISNFAVILAGTSLKFINNAIADYNLVIKICAILLCICAILIMITYSWINNNISKQIDIAMLIRPNKKIKPSLKESFKLIFSSKYLGFVTLLLLCYGISINLVEGPWKDKVKELYPSRSEYTNFMASFNQAKGIVCFFFYIIASNIIPRFKWLTSALLTPVMMCIIGVSFYVFVITSDKIGTELTIFTGINLVTLSVIFGSVQNILSKANKYSFFDSTKEMTYIPLDDELKTKGKAAVDVIGGRVGKSLGAVIQFLIFAIFPSASFSHISPYLMVAFIIVTIIWIYAAVQLSKEYEKKLQETNYQ